MPYTGNPSTVPADMVRFLLADLDPGAPIFADDEVVAALAQANGPYGAAAWLADRKALAVVSVESITVDGISLGGGAGQGDLWAKLAEKLRADAIKAGEGGSTSGPARRGAAVILTGARLSDMRRAEYNSDRATSAIRRENEADICTVWDRWL